MPKTSQFIRTDKAIIHALIALLKEKSFEKITVADILTQTPVTRTTFYAHFKDKYEIAERMLEEYQRLHEEIMQKMKRQRKADYPLLIHAAVMRNREMMEALLKIHTDKVDLLASLVKELEEEYLRSSTSPSKTVEAAVYAQTLAAFELSFLRDDSRMQFTPDYVDQVMTEVFLRILKIENPSDKEYLRRQIRQHLPDKPAGKSLAESAQSIRCSPP